MVPEGWETRFINQIAKVASGGTPNKSEDAYWGGNIPWVTTSEVKFEVIVETALKITQAGLDNSSAKLFPEGTILMAMYGQGKTRGQVALLGIEASTNQACAAIILKKGYEIDFYFQYLASRYGHIRDLSNSGGQKNLSAGIVKSIKVPVPPLPEQKKIAQILATWDKAIATTEQLLANSQQQKKALMQQLLTGKKRLLDENGKPFSGEWDEFDLDELFSFKKGQGISKAMLADDGRECVLYGELYTRYGEVITETVSRTKSNQGIESQFGDILIPASTTTTGIDLANASALLMNDVLLGGDINILRPKVPLDAPFFAYLITHIKKFELARRAQGITIIHLYGKDLKSISVRVPKSIDEQKEISGFIESIQTKVDFLADKIVKLKLEKKALMQQLLTGKRRVKVDQGVV